MHWGIAYLREDIQDLRSGVRAMHDRMDRLAEASSARTDAMNENLTKRIDSRFALMLTAMIALSGIIIGANIAVMQMYLPSP